jgi:ribosomal-protein-alanine N-acetyltransferase
MQLPSIATQRLVLRPVLREDVDALHELWTTPEVRRYLWDGVVIEREIVEHVVDLHLTAAERHSIGYWALHLHSTAASVRVSIAGFCGFRFIDDTPEIELMYALKAEHWGQGLATEAALAAIEYLWRSTTFQLIYARTDPPNEQSVRVMQRIGMTHESTSASTIVYVLRRPA